MAKAKNIKTHVQRVLKEAGLYRPELNYQIELLANDLVIYRILMDKAVEVSQTDEEIGTNLVIITEKSREGDERLRPHPIFAMVQAQANQLRQDLKVLLMNYDKTDNSSIKKEDNPLENLMRDISNVGDEGED